MQRYLQRQEQAKELRAEKERLAEKVFKSGQNWKPTPTVPVTPKISGATVKGERYFDLNVKALSKPVNSIRKYLNPDAANELNQILPEMTGFE